MSVIRDLFTSSVNSTMMSINERFTYLQKKVRPVQTPVITIRANNAARQEASAENRRLALEMEKRLSAMAALNNKKKSIRLRIGLPLVVGGQGSNVRDRLTLPGRGRARLRNAAKNKPLRGRSLRRAQSVQSLTGGNFRRSMQSLNNEMPVPHRSRSRSRTRNRTPSVGPERVPRRGRSASGIRQGMIKKANAGFFRQQMLSPQIRRRSNSVSFKGRRGRNIGNQVVLKNQKAPVFQRRGSNFQSSLGRGQFRGRGGRGRGRGGIIRNIRGSRNGPLTKEDLDKELDQYMANTKSQLDKDIDTYMKENAEAEMWE